MTTGRFGCRTKSWWPTASALRDTELQWRRGPADSIYVRGQDREPDQEAGCEVGNSEDRFESLHGVAPEVQDDLNTIVTTCRIPLAGFPKGCVWPGSRINVGAARVYNVADDVLESHRSRSRAHQGRQIIYAANWN